MIITTNRYVVRGEYAAQNQEYIRRVTEELRGLHYQSHTGWFFL